MDKLTDQQIMEKLRSPLVKDQESAFSYLYQVLFAKTVMYIRKNNGTAEEARDIFQDALFVFYKVVREGRVEENTNPEAYIYTVFRNLWLKKLQKAKRETALDESIHDSPIAPEQLDQLLQTEQHVLLREALQSLGKDCQTILIAFYYNQMRMEEIVKTLNYTNVQVAKNKKYKCMKKLKQLVLNSDHFQNYFKEF